MKEYEFSRTVQYPEYQVFSGIVRLNAERLTPAVARRALQVAFGQPYNGTVYDPEAGYGYRIYCKSHRKFTP